MTDKHAGEEIRALRLSQGLSQQDVAEAVDISLKTVGRLEKEGRGHHLRRVRNFLERLKGEASPAESVDAVRSFIEQQSSPGGKPLAFAFHELAAMLERLPSEQKAPAVQTFLNVQRQLDDASVEPLKTLEAAAQITVKAFSQFAR